MTPVKFDQLPKIKGAGRKGSGIWPGHADEARTLKQQAMAKLDEEQWGCIETALRVHTASRLASHINKGSAEDFKPDAEGSYKAVTRKSPDHLDEDGRPLYDLWACYVYTGPPKQKRGRKAS